MAALPTKTVEEAGRLLAPGVAVLEAETSQSGRP